MVPDASCSPMDSEARRRKVHWGRWLLRLLAVPLAVLALAAGAVMGLWPLTPSVASPSITYGTTTTTLSGKNGSFDLPPVLQTEIAFMYLRNPDKIPGTFVVSAEGYATNELHGFATSRDRWRVRLGKVPLKKLANGRREETAGTSTRTAQRLARNHT